MPASRRPSGQIKAMAQKNVGIQRCAMDQEQKLYAKVSNDWYNRRVRLLYKGKKSLVFGENTGFKRGRKKVKDIIQENLDIICKLRKKDISIIGYSALEGLRTAYSEVIEADIYTGDLDLELFMFDVLNAIGCSDRKSLELVIGKRKAAKVWQAITE